MTPGGTRVLAAVARIDDDNRKARHLGGFRLVGRFRLLRFLDQGGERIERHHRIEVKHEAVAVLGDRLERKHLRLHLGLEIEHQAHDARAVVRDAQALDIGIVRRDFGVQLEERGRQLGELEVEHQALRILDAEQRELDLVS